MKFQIRRLQILLAAINELMRYNKIMQQGWDTTEKLIFRIKDAKLQFNATDLKTSL